MCDEAVGIEPRGSGQERNAYTLDNVPDYIMTQKICNEVMHENPAAFFLVPDHFKTQKCV